MALPISDGVVTVRRFEPADRPLVLDGRDEEWERWLGPGSPDPAPTACIEVAGHVVGWIDADLTLAWLFPGEANVGYSIFPAHRGHGYAARAVALLAMELAARDVQRLLLVIDRRNQASLGVARGLGAELLADRKLRELPMAAVYALELTPPRS